MSPFQKQMLSKFGSDRLCIDSTHGMTGYGFELTTLLVVDEYEEGIPVAFFCSSSVNSDNLKVFFNCVKEAVGEVKPRSFMSDDAPAFYNAWVAVMGSVDKRLLCSWHVDRAWQGKLYTIKDNEKKKIVYKALRTCHTELDVNNFVKMFAELLEQLKSDPDTVTFGQYLSTHYANRTELWAYSYRTGSRINTNMYIENFHKIIKHIYMQGKKSKRVDKCIDALFSYLLDKQFDRLGKLHKGKLSTKVAKLAHRHKEGAQIISTCVQSNSSEWRVPSCSVNGLVYSVTRIDDHMCRKSCTLVCRECNSCVLAMSCNCHDYQILGNMCKHIHAVNLAELQVNPCMVFIDQSEVPQEVKDEIKFHTETLQLKSRTKTPDAIHRLAQEVIGLVCRNTNVDAVVTDGIVAHLKAAKRLLLMGGKTCNVSNPKNLNPCEPHNKLIVQQKRFFSTKRKRCKKPILQKATTTENATLGRVLLQDEIVINCGDLDHDYNVRSSLLQNVPNKKLNQQLLLTTEERHQIESTQMLTDRHMEIVMTLLEMQFPNVCGLEPTVLSQSVRGFSAQVDNASQVIQVHYTGAIHWVTSSRASNDDFVYLYDSYAMFDINGKPRLPPSLQLQLAQIYRCTASEIPVLLPEMSRQSNGVDCGLYAIATATDLCFGYSPSERNYDQLQLRPHLLECIKNQHMEPFPATKIARTNIVYYALNIYCYCRKPADDSMIDCIVCHESFHFHCTPYKGGDFKCNSCTNVFIFKQ